MFVTFAIKCLIYTINIFLKIAVCMLCDGHPMWELVGITKGWTELENEMDNRIEKWNGTWKNCIKPILI